jgi:endo-1,4-beta-xylanase
MKKNMKMQLFGLAIAVSILSCQATDQIPTLKDAFKNKFYVGVAVNGKHFNETDTSSSNLVKSQYNTVTVENDMKWERVHPKPNQYNFGPVDNYVAYGEKNNMFIVGHCLLWHAQTPNWVFQDSTGTPLTREALLIRLKDHITTIMTRYKGRIDGYDVVNEALNEDGTYRQSKWYKIIGEDYIEKAFQYAQEADPSAALYYNDYNIEQPAKRQGAIKIIQNLKAKGLKVDGIGIQGHYHLDVPELKHIDESIVEFANLGVQVAFTELDINVLPKPENHTGANISDRFKLTEAMNPYPKELPDSMQQVLAKRYADFFTIFVKHQDKIDRVTFWNVNDGDSWLNGWPIRGRTNYPLLFDRKNKPKPAFYSVLETAKGQ